MQQQPIQKRPEEKRKSPEETKQQQTDPNLTELKGLTDKDEKLEPEGTDNPTSMIIQTPDTVSLY